MSVATNGHRSLQTLPRERLIDRAAEAIKDHILTNELKGGDRLPSELELARSLGVSRNVIRQAVSSLEMLGVVSVARGRGIYVADLADTGVFRQLAAWIDPSEIVDSEYIAVRAIFERGIYELIIQNASGEDLDQIAALGAALESSSAEVDFSRLHDEYHQACLAATGNRFLMTLGTILYRFFWSLVAVGPRVRRVSTEEMKTSHRRMAAMLRERQVDMVPEIVSLHLGVHGLGGVN
ncbi:MAG TPA: GntR family transcriptional regulator [Chloroflexota bacterium]|nr:GntR family transcriptional regulator [Chloroflexota bacterium]